MATRHSRPGSNPETPALSLSPRLRIEMTNEITIAGNLKDMFLELTPASDLVFRRAVDVPTVRIEGMMVAGA